MPATTKREVRPDSFAVIRDYKPARIERDLLAQVFDLAQCGSSANATVTQEHGVSNDRQASEALEQADAGSLSNTDHQRRAHALEAVA